MDNDMRRRLEVLNGLSLTRPGPVASQASITISGHRQICKGRPYSFHIIYGSCMHDA